MQEVTVQHKDPIGNSQKNSVQVVEIIPYLLPSNCFSFLNQS